MLLLGDPAMDNRVIKSTRALQAAGYQVTLYYVPVRPSTLPLPDLGGAVVRQVRAPRPLAWLTGRFRRHGSPGTDTPAATSQRSPSPARRLLAELRALVGTLWLNLVLTHQAWHQRAEVIHANDLDTLAAGCLLRRRCGGDLVYDAHELYPDMIADVSPLYAGLWRLIERLLIGRAAAVITVNESLAGELRRRYRLQRLPIVVMNCPPLEPAPSPTPSTVPEYLLLYQGGLHAERGLEDLIAAVPHVNPRAVLCLRGSGPLRATLEQLATQQGVSQRVRFLDPVPPDQVVSALAGFSLGLMPYRAGSLNNYLATPTKLFEYMMGALPVVASDLLEVRRIGAVWEPGIIYPAGDRAALAEAVNTLLADPERAARHGAGGRRAAEASYNWEAQADRLRAAYAGLVGSRLPRSLSRPPRR